MFSTPFPVDLESELFNLRNCRKQILDGKVGYYDRLLFNDRLAFGRHFHDAGSSLCCLGGEVPRKESTGEGRRKRRRRFDVPSMQDFLLGGGEYAGNRRIGGLICLGQSPFSEFRSTE